MNSAVYVGKGGGFKSVYVGTSSAARPQVGEITVSLRASSLNYHDYLVVHGEMGPTSPRIPMSDGAGEVLEVGAGVTEFSVGDRVVSVFFPDWLDGGATIDSFARVPGDGLDGFAREIITCPVACFTKAPEGFSHAEAATLTTAGLTAWRALFEFDAIKPGDSVLVQGTGGVSIFALQFAKSAGARVIATSSSDDKLQRLRTLGADELINYKLIPDWGTRVREMTNGVGVDHVVDVGGPATLPQSIVAAKVGGRISLIGVLTGLSGEMPVLSAILRQQTIQGILVGSRAQQERMIRMINATKMRPVLDRHFNLTDIVDAFLYQEKNRHFGKICLNIGAQS